MTGVTDLTVSRYVNQINVPDDFLEKLISALNLPENTFTMVVNGEATRMGVGVLAKNLYGSNVQSGVNSQMGDISQHLSSSGGDVQKMLALLERQNQLLEEKVAGLERRNLELEKLLAEKK